MSIFEKLYELLSERDCEVLSVNSVGCGKKF